MTSVAPETTASRTAEPEASAPPYSRRYAWYVVGVLMLVYTTGFIDRQVLNLLVGPIKASYALSDVEISLLQGLSFMSAYVLMSPVFGRWVDVGNRRNILVGAAVAWSLFTVACGLARNYFSLFVARVGVGGTEAGLVPASWSIIADYFTPKDMARAFSVYLMGPYIGGGLALVFGGLLLKALGGADGPPIMGFEPWQMTFIVIGLPGVFLALLLFTVREPVRRGSGAASAEKVPMSDVMATVRQNRRFYGSFYFGMSCIILVLYAFPAWIPAVLMRRFDVPPAQVGLEYGAVVLVSGSIGVLAGPVIGRWLERRGRIDAPLRVPVLAALMLVPCSILTMLADSYYAVLAAAGLAGLFYSMPQAMTATALQLMTPNRMRGFMSSIYVFIASVIGLGLAPTLVALVSDHLLGGEQMIGTALAIVCSLSALVAAFLLSRTLQPFRAAMRARGESQ